MVLFSPTQTTHAALFRNKYRHVEKCLCVCVHVHVCNNRNKLSRFLNKAHSSGPEGHFILGLLLSLPGTVTS
jgi:hypothetical protein